MNLRWFVTCNEYGAKSEKELQVWNKDIGRWEEVPYVECKDFDEEEYMLDETAIY